MDARKLGHAVAEGSLDADFEMMQAGEAAAAETASTATARVRVAHPHNATSVVPVLRVKMSQEYLGQLFGVAVAYLQDLSTGAVMWPAKWVADCLGPPTVYWAVEKAVPIVTTDALEEDEYRGDTKLIIMNVPARVDEKPLRIWFQAGLNDEFPELVGAKAGVQTLRAQVAGINHRIAQLPNLGVRVAASNAAVVVFARSAARVWCALSHACT